MAIQSDRNELESVVGFMFQDGGGCLETLNHDELSYFLKKKTFIWRIIWKVSEFYTTTFVTYGDGCTQITIDNV